MKKFLSMAALALALAAVCTAPAPAWLNWKFGLGLSFGWQSGGNNTFWGLFRNGQPPGPDCGFGGGCGGGCPLPPGPGYPLQPGSDNRAAPDAAARPATPQSYQASYQTPWSNYYSNTTAGYRYPSTPYYNYNYNYGYGCGYNYPR